MDVSEGPVLDAMQNHGTVIASTLAHNTPLIPIRINVVPHPSRFVRQNTGTEATLLVHEHSRGGQASPTNCDEF